MARVLMVVIVLTAISPMVIMRMDAMQLTVRIPMVMVVAVQTWKWRRGEQLA